MALTALLASVYVAAVVTLAPISFEVFQIRVADILMPLSIIFGIPAIVGLTIGAFIANFASPFGIIDVVGGSVANFLASYMAWIIGKRRFRGSWIIAILVENLTITFIVGTYLAYLLTLPFIVGWFGVFLGSFVSMNVGGYLLLKALSKRLGRSRLISI
ncbi:MAG: QueT transporter family protein [Nitrososphaerales archaeon]|nr:QueT transporter family protein [Nitrososphaerales archaeon]